MSEKADVRELWKQPLGEADEAMNRWLDQLDEFVASGAEKLPRSFYSEPAESSDAKHKVVRLDVVVMAVHLIVARTIIKTLPDWWTKQLHGVERRIANFLGGKVIGILASKVPEIGQIIEVVKQLSAFMDAVNAQKVIERQIRADSLKMRNNVASGTLSQDHPFKGVHDVHTRHYTEKHERKFKGFKSL